MREPDFWNLYARKLDPSLPEGWRWSKLEALDGIGPRVARIEGGVCGVKFLSGPRKGEDNWAKRDRKWDRTFIIPHADLLAFEAEWERATGLCRHCGDTGEKFVGWNSKTGVRYGPCHCGRGQKKEAAP